MVFSLSEQFTTLLPSQHSNSTQSVSDLQVQLVWTRSIYYSSVLFVHILGPLILQVVSQLPKYRRSISVTSLFQYCNLLIVRTRQRHRNFNDDTHTHTNDAYKHFLSQQYKQRQTRGETSGNVTRSDVWDNTL